MLLMLGACGSANGMDTPDPASAPVSFENVDSNLGSLLVGIDRAHLLLLEELAASPTSNLDGGFYNRIRQGVADGSLASGAAPATPQLARLSPRFVAALNSANALRHRVYEIYADTDVANRRAAVDAAVEAYLANNGIAITSVPKVIEVTDHGHDDDHEVVDEFSDNYPNTAGLYRAFQWLQLAGSEPMIIRMNTGDQRAVLDATLANFARKIETGPDAYPSQTPKAPAIAPELVTWHRDAAAIFDNLNLMLDEAIDILVSGDIRDKSTALNTLVDNFTDPAFSQADHLEWIRESVRYGIYDQGGPAIGELEKSERNQQHHHHGGRHVFPGM